MKTVSISIDDELLTLLDSIGQSTNRTRSDLLRTVIREWLAWRQARHLEQMNQDRAGYERRPVGPEEFGGLLGWGEPR